MLRETKHVRPYPSKTVIEDLVSRDGPADENSYTPFEGKKIMLDRQFSGRQRSKFKLKEFLSYCSNRDLNPSRVAETKVVGMLIEQTGKVGSYVTLEDMIKDGVENPGVAKYLQDLCVGFKKDNTSPYNTNAEYQTITITNRDGDDGEVEEKMLINRVDYDEISNAEYEEILKHIPYLIKSIWSYSKLYKANLFSFMFAYQDIYERKRGRVTITDFADYPTYLLKSDGTYVRPFSHSDDNKYTIYPAATKIFLQPSRHTAEFDLCTKYLKYLKILGIDYHDEEPLDYNNDFVNSLLCTYLPNNDEYFNKYKDIDIEIMVALKPENILSVPKSRMYMQSSSNKEFDYNDSAYFISERLKLASKLGDYNAEMFEEREEHALKLLGNVLYLMNRDKGNNVVPAVPRQSITFEVGGLMYYNKKMLTVDGKYFGLFKGRNDHKAIITKYGFVVVLEESYEDVYYLSVEDTLDMIEEYIENGEIQSKANWKSL